jgi:transposase
MLKQEDVLEGPFEVWGEIFDKLGIEDILGLSDRGRGATHALKLCLSAKLTDGGSKRRSALWLTEQLGMALSEDRFYRMMDKLSAKTDKVKELGFMCGRSLCDNKISLVLFDVTTLYFESFLDDEDESVEAVSEEASGETPTQVKAGLRRHGFSKDCKFKETQIVLALASSADGIPLLKKLDKNGEVQVKTIISNRGTSKYIEPSEGNGEAKYCLNQAKIEEDAKYDGLHGVETDRTISNEEDVKAVLGAYGSLWNIEDCFRVSKSDLKFRPIYHWTHDRVRAHVAICFLALLMERYLEKHLRIRRHVRLSAQRIKDALLKVNSTIIKDTEGDKLYRFPSRLSKDAREIYKALDLKRGMEPTEITSMVKYRRRIPNLPGEVYEEPEDRTN